ncbi:MAG: hypothetical protein PHH58_09915 [Rhodoferax sp.]|nr:hypothetical protein [Rhodoferax sp.]
MKTVEMTLTKKLAVVLVLKLVVLLTLWWGLVRDQRVAVDGASVAAQFLGSAQAPSVPVAAGLKP